MKVHHVFAALLAMSGMAHAEGWTISDLGSEGDRDTCMSKAERTFRSYAADSGVEEVIGRSEWTVAGYDLRGGLIDAIIICPIEGGLVAPFLLTYSGESDDDARKIIHDRIYESWGRQ